MTVKTISLQINMSPGDISYASLTVPALISHHPEVNKVLLVVDVCKPGKTKLVDPDKRFPEPAFSMKSAEIVRIAENIVESHAHCEMYVLRPDDPVIKKLGRKYLDGWYYHTHDYGGCANMAYWLGFDLPNTDYVLHYDCDIVLYQKSGFSWTADAIRLMGENPSAVAATPRFNTPFPESESRPSCIHGVAFQKRSGCWLDSFFSTRCLFIDKKRLDRYLPLLKGRILYETLLVKYLNRGYPRSPEIVMFRRIGGHGGHRLIIDNFDSWFMHPLSKPPVYIKHLKEIMNLIHAGIYPEGHQGDNFELDKWIMLIENAGKK